MTIATELSMQCSLSFIVIRKIRDDLMFLLNIDDASGSEYEQSVKHIETVLEGFEDFTIRTLAAVKV